MRCHEAPYLHLHLQHALNLTPYGASVVGVRCHQMLEGRSEVKDALSEIRHDVDQRVGVQPIMLVVVEYTVVQQCCSRQWPYMPMW